MSGIFALFQQERGSFDRTDEVIRGLKPVQAHIDLLRANIRPSERFNRSLLPEIGKNNGTFSGDLLTPKMKNPVKTTGFIHSLSPGDISGDFYSEP